MILLWPGRLQSGWWWGSFLSSGVLTAHHTALLWASHLEEQWDIMALINRLSHRKCKTKSGSFFHTSINTKLSSWHTVCQQHCVFCFSLSHGGWTTGERPTLSSLDNASMSKQQVWLGADQTASQYMTKQQCEGYRLHLLWGKAWPPAQIITGNTVVIIGSHLPFSAFNISSTQHAPNIKECFTLITQDCCGVPLANLSHRWKFPEMKIVP